jgi:HPt (histidine-containing phosphotransfer) domain-containing protein
MDKLVDDLTQTLESDNRGAFEFDKGLDVTFLATTYGANLSFGAKMFGIFVSSIHLELDALEASATHKDYPTIRAIAHKIKNNFTWVGLAELSVLTAQIETLARQEKSSVISLVDTLGIRCRECMPSVEAQYRSLQAAVRGHRDH